MKRYLILSLITWGCAAFMGSTAFSQLKKSYYQTADGLKKEALKTALGNIIADHTKISYGDLWKAYEKVDYVETDRNADGQYRVFDYYSDDPHYFNGDGTAVSGMNKEHVVPQSWWGKGTSINVGCDLMQVMPSQSTANSSKGNYCLGIAKTKVKVVNNRMKTGKNENDDYVFEPCDEYKGDFARVYFYVAVCYPNVAWETSVQGTEVAFKRESYPTLKSDFQTLLLQWSRQDPVSEWEITRNNRVYGEQNNRNPFVDFPQLAEYIWGDSIDYAWDLATAIPNGVVIPGDTIPTDTIVVPVDTIPTDTIVPDTIPVDTIALDSLHYLELAFIETFDDIQKGESTSTGGSNTAWTGNDSIPTANTAYQAGGAIRLGTKSKTGYITTIPIPADQGDTLRVEISVKGWTTVEGNLKVSLTDTPEQTLSYTATMSDRFETVEATFIGIPTSNPQLTISTTEKRCFIDDIRVYKVKTKPVVKPDIPEEPTEEEKEKQRLLELCDLDGDGMITVVDITMLINIYLEPAP